MFLYYVYYVGMFWVNTAFGNYLPLQQLRALTELLPGENTCFYLPTIFQLTSLA
jgi:hypothetical protein